MSFAGVTFAEQSVTPSDDAIVRRAILPDGILTGCAISYSGSTLTMGAGHLMVCGRQIKHLTAQNWAVVDATSGYARLVLTIDLTRTATEEVFDQVMDSIEYASAEDGFVELDQSDINTSGNRYQVAVCVVSLGTGGITGIVSQLEKSAVDGSGALNFKVVGGLTQPSGPKENTIWVKTDADITGYLFSAVEPTEPIPGMVWIKIEATGSVVFDALKKTGIVLRPTVCHQYINGVWVQKNASIFQKETWVDLWTNELYAFGNEWSAITGGWTGTGVKSSSTSSVGAVPPEVARGINSITASADKGGGVFHTVKKINLTQFSTITFTGNFARGGTAEVNLLCGCWEDFGTYYSASYAAATPMSKNSETVIVVDVSALNGEYYVGIGLVGGSSAEVSRVLLA